MTNSVNLKWFALVYVAAMVGITLISGVLLFGFGIDVPASATQFIPVLIATMHVGKMYFEDYQQVPDVKEAWAASRRMTLVEMAISLPLGAVFIALLLGDSDNIDWTIYGPVFLVGAGFLFAISLVAKRFLFVTGAKGAQTQQEKKQAS
ncbi:ABZJ_00895 family protein [Roseibium sediminis]|uniref:ABZJ_00895 family protein n=1 Tax=Roseibium sediminis TaxID=1775174 RepID=UPI00123E277C|nr:ABZJ_00895 family protein [Roseibium sediminis]